LQYQRQLALQKMQEQERERIMRQEQAKQQYLLQQQAAAVMANHMQQNIHQPIYQGQMIPNQMPPYQQFVQYPQHPAASMGMSHFPPANMIQDGSPQLPPPNQMPMPGQLTQGSFNMQPLQAVMPSQNYPPVSQAQMGGTPVLVGQGTQQIAPNTRPQIGNPDQSELISFD